MANKDKLYGKKKSCKEENFYHKLVVDTLSIYFIYYKDIWYFIFQYLDV